MEKLGQPVGAGAFQGTKPMSDAERLPDKIDAKDITPSTTHEAEQAINELRPRIAAKLSQHMWTLVDQENLSMKPVELATIWGIAMDKEQKAKQLEHPAIDNRQLVIILQGDSQEPVTIDVPPLEPGEGPMA